MTVPHILLLLANISLVPVTLGSFAMTAYGVYKRSAFGLLCWFIGCGCLAIHTLLYGWW